MGEEYLKKLVVARLKAIPPNISFSVGSFGDFTRDELIREIGKGSEVGMEFAKMEINFILESPHLVGNLHGKAPSSH